MTKQKNIWFGSRPERSGLEDPRESAKMLLLMIGWAVGIGMVIFLVPAMLILNPPIGVLLMIGLAVLVIVTGVKNAPW